MRDVVRNLPNTLPPLVDNLPCLPSLSFICECMNNMAIQKLTPLDDVCHWLLKAACTSRTGGFFHCTPFSSTTVSPSVHTAQSSSTSAYCPMVLGPQTSHRPSGLTVSAKTRVQVTELCPRNGLTRCCRFGVP